MSECRSFKNDNEKIKAKPFAQLRTMETSNLLYKKFYETHTRSCIYKLLIVYIMTTFLAKISINEKITKGLYKNDKGIYNY